MAEALIPTAEDVIPAGNPIDVFAANHPLRAGREHTTVPAGSTLQEIVDRATVVPEVRSHALVYVGDRYVPASMWPYTRPREGATVAIRVVPLGGGGGDKNPLRTVLMIAVVAAASWVSGGAGGAITQGFWSYAAGAAVGILGRMLVDEIAPLPTAEDGVDEASSDARKYSVDGARNRALRYEAIPRALGQIRWVPPYSAVPFTEVQDNDQYLRFAVCWGYGPQAISNVRIGETPIEDYDNVEVSHDFGDGNGWTNGNIVSQDVTEQSLSVLLRQSDSWQQRTTETNTDEISVDIGFLGGLVEFNDDGSRSSIRVGVEIQYAEAGTNNWNIPDGGSVTFGARQVTLQTLPEVPADELWVTAWHTVYIDRMTGDLGIQAGTGWTGGFSGSPVPDAPRGAVGLATFLLEVTESGFTEVTQVSNENRAGSTFASSSDFQVSHSSGLTFNVSGGSLLHAELTNLASTSSTLRRNFAWKVPNGQYDVRLRRVTADRNDDRIRDQVTWTKLRSITHREPIDPDFAAKNSIAQTAVRIKATDQLNGVVDQLNAVTTSIVPDYDADSDTWITRPTNNNAALARAILQDAANPEALPDDRLDLPAFESLAERVNDKAWSYGGVISGGNVTDALREVLSIARASRSVVDGIWTVISDEPRTTPVQHLTPKNSKSLSATKRFMRKPHALRVRFKNAEAGYQEDERIVYDDGYSANGSGGTTAATIFEDLQAPGITDKDHAYSYGRYIMASNRLRPEVYSLEVDVEHLVATPGDLVLVQHDVPLFGITSGRVKSVDTDSSGDITGVTVDEELTLEGGKTYAMRFRLQDGDSVVRTLSFSDSGDTVTSTVAFDSVIDGSDPVRDGDLFMFGEESSETIEAVVQSIGEGNSRWDATIALVDHAQPAIENAVDVIPAYDSQISEPQPFVIARPPEPIVTGLRSDEAALQRNDDGTLIVHIMVAYEVPSTNQRVADGVQGRYRKTGQDDDWAIVETTESHGRMFLGDVNAGEVYRVEIRSLTDDGVASDWVVAAASHTIIGKTSLPPNVTNVHAVQEGNSVTVAYQPVVVKDLAGYQVRYGRQGNSTWETANRLGNVAASDRTASFSIPPGTWTIFVKAFDTTGNFSRRPGMKNLTVRNSYVVLSDVEHRDTWAGKQVNMQPTGVALEPTNDYLAAYETEEVDLGFEAQEFRVWADIQLSKSNVDATQDFGTLDEVVDTVINDGLIADGVTSTVDDGDLLTSIPISDDARITYQIAVREAGDTLGSVDMVVDDGAITAAVTETVDDGSITDPVDSVTFDDSLAEWVDWSKGEVEQGRFVRQRILMEGDGEGLPMLIALRTVIDTAPRVERFKDVSVPIGGTTVTFDRRFHSVPNAVAEVEANDARYPVRESMDVEEATYRVHDETGSDVGGTIDVTVNGA